MTTSTLNPDQILDTITQHPKFRARDLAEKFHLQEADLVAARIGHGARRIHAHPDQLMPALGTVGETMALTRNESVVHERTGDYLEYHSSQEAAMVIGPEIDLRIFPGHWQYAFALDLETSRGLRRSVQVFDAAGTAVHKTFAVKSTDQAAWDRIIDELATGDDNRTLELEPRATIEAPIIAPGKIDQLRQEWSQLTDTLQFLPMTRRLGINRLGALRMAGAPFARALETGSIPILFERLATDQIPLMLFVGNPGCIQIHTGPIQTLRTIGAWFNVMDPRFNMHLRGDRIAEVWRVEKPTRQGPAVSVEAYDPDGDLIFQLFGLRKPDLDLRAAFIERVDDLPEMETM